MTSISAEYVEKACATEGCGILFFISEPLHGRLRENHKNFYCPNGHSMWFPGETEEAKLRRALREANQTAANLAIEVRSLKRKKRGSKKAS